MKINWKVRFNNPIFWAQLCAAIVLPILTYFGLNWSDMTTWPALGNLLIEAAKNPVVLVAVVVSVFNTVTDPTTRGLSDSPKALTYKKPQ